MFSDAPNGRMKQMRKLNHTDQRSSTIAESNMLHKRQLLNLYLTNEELWNSSMNSKLPSIPKTKKLYCVLITDKFDFRHICSRNILHAATFGICVYFSQHQNKQSQNIFCRRRRDKQITICSMFIPHPLHS